MNGCGTVLYGGGGTAVRSQANGTVAKPSGNGRGDEADRATWRQRQTFSVRAFLVEYYGYSSESEAKTRNRFLRGDLAKRIAAYLREFGGWSDKPVQTSTSYGRVREYVRLS